MFQRAELPGLLAAHDAGLFTSRSEGWGLCLNEMLEAGLPVAATSAGGGEDLRPFWGPRLLPFPPPAEVAAPDLDSASLERYLHWSSWEEIARRYEEEALLPTVGREGSGGGSA
jgi:glycosyltransferase involved in cell wall biosynthesis